MGFWYKGSVWKTKEELKEYNRIGHNQIRRIKIKLRRHGKRLRLA